jgi:hypothetical protein
VNKIKKDLLKIIYLIPSYSLSKIFILKNAQILTGNPEGKRKLGRIT